MDQSKDALSLVRELFDQWSRGEGSLNDLLADDAEVVIPGTLPHCGTFTKGAFIRDVAGPFTARFRVPPAPRARRLWADGDAVVVLADATGTRRDGVAYANAYVFVLELVGGRVVRATEFLDMAAFNAVWDEVALVP